VEIIKKKIIKIITSNVNNVIALYSKRNSMLENSILNFPKSKNTKNNKSDKNNLEPYPHILYTELTYK